MRKLHRISFVRAAALSSAVFVAGACATSSTVVNPTSAPASLASNPLFVESTLPYHAPRFDLIRNEHYQPALEERVRQQLAEIDVIAKQTQAPTFENTIEAMERSGALLTRANNAFQAVVGANTNDTLQKVDEKSSPKLAAHSDAIYLNDQLYSRFKNLYDRRDSSNLTPEQKALVETLYNRDFLCGAGAQLSETDKIRMRALNQELSKLRTDFTRKLLAGTKAGALVVDSPAQLEGMSDAEDSRHGRTQPSSAD